MDNKIERLIPHRPPILMVDKLLHFDSGSALTEKTFKDSDYGVKNGLVLEIALVECMAQSVAIKEGIDAEARNRKPDTGMLVSVDNFDFFSSVQSNTRLEIYAEKTGQVGSCVIINGEIREGEKIVAKGGLKIFIIDIEQQKT
jgi:predicted hotdog family 3-hydroxylacyl-ACP dehydratase